VRSSKSILFICLAVPLAAASAFFTYYTLRLAYVSLAFAHAAKPGSWGVYIGAVVFPLASLVFGYLTYWCAKRGIRS